MTMIIKELSLLLLFITNALSDPINGKDADTSKQVIDENMLLEKYIFYRAKHDIVKIVIPINDLNNVRGTEVECDDKDGSNSKCVTMFFVEADIKQNSIEYIGLSIFKDGKVKKLLENGRDAVSGDIDTKDVYFAASDGLYSYDSEKNEAKKYGSIDDNLIAITKVNASDMFYVLNNKNELLKVTEKGTKKHLVSDVKGAKQIVCMPDGSLFYVDGKNDIYVLKETGVAKISGLPDSMNSIKILSVSVVLLEDYVTIAFVDNTFYLIDNGTAEKLNTEFKVKPTAYAVDATLSEWIAVDKNIYYVSN